MDGERSKTATFRVAIQDSHFPGAFGPRTHTAWRIKRPASGSPVFSIFPRNSGCPPSRRQSSVRGLMVPIVGVAVGLTALRNANVSWASATATVVVVAVATSVMGSLPLSSRERSAWTGFAVFSGVYLAVAVGTVVSNGFKDQFGPTVALTYIESKVSGDQSDPITRPIRLRWATRAVQQDLTALRQQQLPE